MRKWFIFVFAANIAVLLISLLILPERIAVHFGLGGEPDRWASRETNLLFFVVFLVPMFALLWYSARLMLAVPAKWINLPHKEYWLKPERRAEMRRMMERLFHEFGIALFAFFFYISLLTIDANLSDPVRLNEALFLPGLVIFLAYTVYWTIKLVLAFRVPPDSHA